VDVVLPWLAAMCMLLGRPFRDTKGRLEKCQQHTHVQTSLTMLVTAVQTAPDSCCMLLRQTSL